MANKCKSCPNTQDQYPFIGDECIDCYQKRYEYHPSALGRAARAVRGAYREAQDRRDERARNRTTGDE